MNPEVPTSELSGFSSDCQDTPSKWSDYSSVELWSPQSCRTSELSELSEGNVSGLPFSPRKRRCLNLEWSQEGGSQRTSQLSECSESALGCGPLENYLPELLVQEASTGDSEIDEPLIIQSTSGESPGFRSVELEDIRELSQSTSRELNLPKDAFLFLDLRNDDMTLPLCNELWNAGVSVSPFLCKGVTHLITDRERSEQMQPKAALKNSLTRTFPAFSRSACMVRKSLNSTNGCQGDIFMKAQSLNVEIVSLQDLQRYLHVKNSSVRRKAHVRKLKPPFIKVEDRSRRFKPLVKEFSQWPVLESFCEDKEKPAISKKKASVFCENCNILIAQKELNSHFKSDLHQEQISQEGYYDSLDRTRLNTPSLQEFLGNIRSKNGVSKN